jgi:phosphoglycolate phosphatase/pyrophosphatase PpaX
MKKPRAFDLIVFDMDGTLIDSMGCLEDWIYRAVKPYCAPGLKPADVSAAFGPTEKEIIARFVPADAVQACLESYYTFYEQEHVLRVRVYPEVDFLLKELRRTRVPTALFTGKSRRAVEMSLDQLGWCDIFQNIVTGDDIKRAKPDPEGLNTLLKQTAASPARTLYIGDSPSDIAAARNAGVKSGHARWGLASDIQPDGALPPDYKLTAPDGLSRLIFGSI